MRTLHRHLLAAVVATLFNATFSACGDAGQGQLTVELGRDDDTCAGTATFTVPAGWEMGDRHHLVHRDKGIDVYISCRSRARFQELFYTGPWTLDDVDRWFAAGSPTTPQASTLGDHPAVFRERPLQLGQLLHVAVLSTIVGDTFVDFTAEVYDGTTYAAVEEELIAVLTGAQLSLPSEGTGRPALR